MVLVILNLIDHLHRSHSTNPNDLPANLGIRYFLENNVPDLLWSGKIQLEFSIPAYNKSKSGPAVAKAANKFLCVLELEGQNKKINKLFNIAHKEASIMTNHLGI